MIDYSKLEDMIITFWSKVDMRGNDECWEWQGLTSKAGYGRSRWLYGNEYAHRIAYELFYETEPKALHVCHRCDNPACCNPKHLFLGTHQDNMRDRERKGRGKGHENIRKAHLMRRIVVPDETVEQLRMLYDTGNYSVSELSREFGISNSYAWYLAKRKLRV